MIRERLGRLEGIQTSTERISSAGNPLWERLPGIVSWLVVSAPIWMTLLSPGLGLALVLAATAYFAARTSYYGPRALINRVRVLRSGAEDWRARLEELHEPNGLNWRHCRITLMIRVYNERNLDMLRDTLESICASNWPVEGGRLRNVEVLFATEEDDPYTPPLVDKLAEEFADRLKVRQIRHPEERDRLPGPSTAMNYVGRALYQEAIRDGFSPRQWVVADFDADTIFHPQYLPCLVYHYVTDPHRDKRAFQPVVLFTTDYWRAPLHSRLSAIGTSMLTLGWNRRPEIAFTGAAASLAALHSVGFWPTNSHSQDSGVEMRFRMRYGRQFRVVGLPIPLWVYPVMPVGPQTTFGEKARAYWGSCKALFRQSARWREGPLDEFVEASTRGYPWLAFKKLWNGLERDTMTLMPGYGLLVAAALAPSGTIVIPTDTLRTVVAVGLTSVSMLGLLVFWKVLGTREFVPGGSGAIRRAWELALFWMVFSIYVPIFTSVAGLRTSTAYALGKRPRGHFIPTPK